MTERKFQIVPLLAAGLLLLAAACGDKAKEQKIARNTKEFCSEFYIKGELPSAITKCLEAERLDPEDADVQLLLGLIYRGLRNYPEAINRMNKAIGIKPEFPEAYTNLGILYSEVGRNADSLQAFDKALSYDFYTKPDLVHLNKCEVFLRMREFRKALESCRAATQMNRSSWEGHLKTGDVLQAMDKIPEAVEAYESAIRYGDKFPQPYYQLGDLYLKQKQFPKACENFIKVKEVALESEYGDKASRFMKQLQCKEPPKETKKLPPAMNLDHLESGKRK